jgi:5-(carboxyamino)imidazole ribonucleotide mutase
MSVVDGLGHDAGQVAVVMGSSSDLATMEPALEVLRGFAVPATAHVISAHRSPEAMVAFGLGAADAGVRVIIAGAGGAAHLPGMLASVTRLPVIGVPVSATVLAGVDALLSIAQMPEGVPVATMAIGGAANAALLAVRILALGDPVLAAALDEHRAGLRRRAADGDADVARRTGRGPSVP